MKECKSCKKMLHFGMGCEICQDEKNKDGLVRRFAKWINSKRDRWIVSRLVGKLNYTEKAVYKLSVYGLTNSEIGSVVGVSGQDVSIIREGIYEKHPDLYHKKPATWKQQKD